MPPKRRVKAANLANIESVAGPKGGAKENKKTTTHKKESGKKETNKRVVQKGGCGCSGAVMPQ